MKQIILGTAGHIDHGKTSLIRTLTGTDTDRLKEEKRRGITIELGFASLDLPSGQHLGIVDVPGHEKFVKNMVAGATGIDIVAMIIAADEGVMPQTREHMEICSLLGIKHGLVVLTKVDLVDEEWLELVTEDISAFTEGTFLESSPIMPVSSTTGQGMPELIAELDRLAEDVPQKSSTSLFRLPVDRVFSMKGFGTVITGTIVSGNIQAGDTIMIYPSGITSKIRGIQVHGKSVESAEAGMRTAINFQGIDVSSVNRGDVIARPDTLEPSYMIDAVLNYLESNERPAKNRTQVRFHAGTNEILGNLILLDRDELLPGDSAPVQIRLESPVNCVKDDRFVIRSYSPVQTIGGGSVLNPIPSKHKRFRDEIAEGIIKLADDDSEQTIGFHVKQSGYKGISFSHLKLLTNITEKQLNTSVQNLLSAKTIIQTDKENRIYLHSEIFEKLISQTLGFLERYHKTNPLKDGMPKEELKSKFPAVLGTKFFNQMMSRLIKEGQVVHEKDIVRLSDHTVALQIDQEDLSRKILETYRETGLTPPFFKDVCKSFEVNQADGKDVLLLLVKDGKIIKAKEDLYFDSDAVETLKEKVIDFLKKNEEMSAPEFKELAGVSRKYLIPLLEYFDSRHVTIRIGDIRKLRKQV